jgi:hypothetical protein
MPSDNNSRVRVVTANQATQASQASQPCGGIFAGKRDSSVTRERLTQHHPIIILNADPEVPDL